MGHEPGEEAVRWCSDPGNVSTFFLMAMPGTLFNVEMIIHEVEFVQFGADRGDIRKWRMDLLGPGVGNMQPTAEGVNSVEV